MARLARALTLPLEHRAHMRNAVLRHTVCLGRLDQDLASLLQLEERTLRQIGQLAADSDNLQVERFDLAVEPALPRLVQGAVQTGQHCGPLRIRPTTLR